MLHPSAKRANSRNPRSQYRVGVGRHPPDDSRARRWVLVFVGGLLALAIIGMTVASFGRNLFFAIPFVWLSLTLTGAMILVLRPFVSNRHWNDWIRFCRSTTCKRLIASLTGALDAIAAHRSRSANNKKQQIKSADD